MPVHELPQFLGEEHGDDREAEPVASLLDRALELRAELPPDDGYAWPTRLVARAAQRRDVTHARSSRRRRPVPASDRASTIGTMQESAEPVTAPVVPVGVAISTFGRRIALRRCLRSLAEGGAHPAEVVVVDQSRDASARPVVDAVDQLRNVRHVGQAAIGLGVAQNEAVRQTTTPIVAVLDDDCVADTDWVAGLYRVLGPGTAVDVVGGR